MLFYTIEPVSINLNGGKPVIEDNEYLFEPGMTVEKPFYIGNEGSWDVYYKIYLNNVSGEFADLIEITILNGKTVLYEGTAQSLTRDRVSVVDDILLSGDRRHLTIRFHLPDTAEILEENGNLKFDFCADAVQIQNNSNKNFE